MKTEDLIEEIERNRHLSEFEEIPLTARDYFSAMPGKDLINRYIEYLIHQSESKDLQNHSLQFKIDEQTEKFGESMLKINELLEEQLKADRYGKNRRRSKDDDKDGGMDPTDRTEDEEVYDGSDAGTTNPMPSNEKECRSSSATGQTFNVANRPETYKSMGVNGCMIVHKSDRNRIPEGSRVIETKNVVLYSLEMSLVAHEYEMHHVVEPGKKPVWKYYPAAGHLKQIMRFDGQRPLRSSCRPLPMRYT